MRKIILFLLLAPFVRAEGEKDKNVNKAVVKDVRALLSAKKQKDIDTLKQKLFSRKDLDWASVKEGLMAGPYYRAPLVTAFGVRHSGKHMAIRLTGNDQQERGFSCYVPKSYNAKDKIPVLFYLHARSRLPRPNNGATQVHSAMMRFKEAAEKNGVLFVAPYTSRGAAWWMPGGLKLVRWTLARIKERYNIDEDRVALAGAQDGAEGVWAIAQQMPGTFSCLMPMSGDHYEITGLVRPLYLGTLDRMDILMGVPGKIRGTLGDKNALQYLAALKPMIDKGMRITTVIAPHAQGDFRYLPRIREDIMAWVKSKKRAPLADEVDIESDNPAGLRSLWLETHGVDVEGEVSPHLPSTRLVWTPPARPKARKDGDKKPTPKLGVNLGKKPKERAFGLRIDRASGAAEREGLFGGDVLVEVNGVKIISMDDVKKTMRDAAFGKEAKVVVLRELKESEVEQVQKAQALYMKMSVRRRELVAAGKPVPKDLLDRMEMEDEEEEEDDEDGCTTIDMGGGNGAGDGADESEKTVFVPLVRFLQLRRPMGGKLVRNDFGANWDRTHKGRGVKVVDIYAGGLAQRSGFKVNDIIIVVGSDDVNRAPDIRKFFADFKFEKEKKGERFVEFTVRRGTDEKTVHVSWEPPVSSRVDVKWKKKERIYQVMTRHANRFTIYLTDELAKPGEHFYLYINGVPYGDLVDPSSTPAYPVIDVGSDPFLKEKLYSMRQERAKRPGWTPDLKWAIEDALERRDRGLIMGAKLTIDMTKLSKGFGASKARNQKNKAARAAKVEQAYDEYKSKGS